MNRPLLRAFAVITMAVGGLLIVPTPSHAATIEVGWWSRANMGSSPQAPAVPVVPAPQVTLPAEPPAPPNPPNAEGGLQVAALPDGASAIAAVRVDQELTSLTLRVAPNGDANGMSAKLAACAAAAPWEPVLGGQWPAKPVVACDLVNGGGSVAGIRADDGSWTFPVAPIAADGKTDVVIVPLADSELADGVVAPFQIVFVPPTASDMVVAPVSAEPSASPVNEETEALFNDPRAYEEFTSITDDIPVAAPIVRPALEERDQAPVLPAFAAAKANDTSAQLLGALLVLLGVAALLWAAHQPTPAIVSMVRGGRVAPGVAPQVGGLGRFARAREGRPPSLQ
ncbi:MAG TPA: hypothetical protein VMZ22_09915 [Acidimicrobiales bacterium]|nr:hypothetical protein [Acidimicrobiales bacterium]